MVSIAQLELIMQPKRYFQDHNCETLLTKTERPSLPVLHSHCMNMNWGVCLFIYSLLTMWIIFDVQMVPPWESLVKQVLVTDSVTYQRYVRRVFHTVS